MSMLRILTGLIVVTVGCVFSFSQAVSDVKVRVLDFKSGHPHKGWKVGLVTGDKWLVAKTAEDGVISFHVTAPLPQKLTIDAAAGGWSRWSCSDSGVFQTSDVLEHGVVTGLLHHPLCQGHSAPPTVAHTGEIVLFTRHLNA